MALTRRTFIKTLAAGITITVLPIPALEGPSIPITADTPQYKIKIKYVPTVVSMSDPYGEIDYLSWKVHGQDNIQYGSYFEFTDEAADHKQLPIWIEKEIAKEMDMMPALDGIRRPTKYQIADALLRGYA